MDFSHFVIPFISIALAELGDKTQLGVVLLASKTRNRLALFWGVMAAFLVVDGVAIALGAAVTRVIPPQVIRTISGALFIICGVLMFRTCGCRGTQEAGPQAEASPFGMGFVMILAAEWGDKTQIASGVFAARFHPAAVLAATLSALALLTALAILAGRWMAGKIPEKILHRIAGILFLLIGLGCFLPF